MNVKPAQSLQLAKSLARHVSGEVYADEYRRALYSTDASIYQIQPLAVVVPRTTSDVVSAVQIAAENGAPVIARGGGTSLSGQSIGAGLVIDFSKYLNQILDIDAGPRTARVQPGVVLDQLNAAAAKHGLQFGPDVATSNRANIGGMIGNNSAGARSVWHGKTVDHVVALDTLLADGTRAHFAPLTAGEFAREQAEGAPLGHIYREMARIIDENRPEIIARFPRLLRRVSGYNLDEFVPECQEAIPKPRFVSEVRQSEQARFGNVACNLSKLIVGSEGTLATVIEAQLHLIPLPAVRGMVVLHFDSLAHAVSSVAAVLSCDPSAAELFDALILRLAERSLEYRNYLDFVVGRPESLMLVEFSGETVADVEAKSHLLAERIAGLSGLENIVIALEPAQCADIWACRKAALPLLLGVPGRRKPVAFVEDAAVDPSRLPDFVARFREILARHDTEGAFYGHASVGCLHIRPMLDLSSEPDIARLEKISEEVCGLVLDFGGAMSGEHGDGLARSYLNERLFGPQVYRAFQQIKAAFDPQGRMNPGKVVSGPSPIENLRYGSHYRTLPVETTFDFSREGSLAQAAEMCNGAGVCRKRTTGTMCPSFMATGDEEHSTRGRANALRLVLSGGLASEGLSGRRLFETYDLCLQCKACKAECPSNVDVAKLKMEFLEHYYRAHGAPLGVRLLGHAATLNRIGSALAPVSNWAAHLPGAGWITEKLLGLDRRRPLPRFERESFQKWFRRRQRGKVTTEDSKQSVVLLDDCLTSYCEPGVNRAAVKVLEAAGFRVQLAGLKCCGRTLVSKGFLGEAQALARKNLDRLAPLAAKEVPIVGCEPSCLLMLVDEYPELVPGEAARQVAGAAALVDTFLVRNKARLALREAPGPILVHGHCHQKALVGVQETRAALQMIPGADVRVLDSGCCGMAGSFGYEHYELSMKIGERVLFPAIREALQAAIAAPGFSCRQQIAHGTNRRGLHPLEIIAGLLG